MARFACVLLVNPAGEILLQERDEHALIDPERWGMVGGHVGEGEEYAAAAYRELAEETGIQLVPPALEPWRELSIFHDARGSTDPVWVYVGATALTDADITVGEGRRILFVDPQRVWGLELTASAARAVPDFLGSPDYARLRR